MQEELLKHLAQFVFEKIEAAEEADDEADRTQDPGKDEKSLQSLAHPFSGVSETIDKTCKKFHGLDANYSLGDGCSSSRRGGEGAEAGGGGRRLEMHPVLARETNGFEIRNKFSIFLPIFHLVDGVVVVAFSLKREFAHDKALCKFKFKKESLQGGAFELYYAAAFSNLLAEIFPVFEPRIYDVDVVEDGREVAAVEVPQDAVLEGEDGDRLVLLLTQVREVPVEIVAEEGGRSVQTTRNLAQHRHRHRHRHHSHRHRRRHRLLIVGIVRV